MGEETRGRGGARNKKRHKEGEGEGKRGKGVYSNIVTVSTHINRDALVDLELGQALYTSHHSKSTLGQWAHALSSPLG